MSEFKDKVIKIVQKIPQGKVMSYGQVALCVGIPRGARQVGWILRMVETKVDIPWWRVINNAGILSIKGNLHNDKHLQKKLLEAERISVSQDFKVDINNIRYIPSASELKDMELDDLYLQLVLSKYF